MIIQIPSLGLKKMFAFLILMMVLTLSLFNHKASATFTANNIMDDSIFNNYTSMSASQIDSFLNSFPNSCISTNHGFSTPDVTGYSPSTGFTYGGDVSAGTAIYHAAQAYELSPKVILSTLQKEQSLVSGNAGCHSEYQGDAPQFYSWGNQQACTGNGTPYSDCANVTCGNGTVYSDCSYACRYSGGGCVQVAVGYDCPGFCKKNSAGFSKQIIKATWSLKFSQQRSLGNYNWNIQKSGWDNSDDPETPYTGPMTQGTLKRCSSCTATYFDGYTTIQGQSVHMDTGATVALYRYTPFFSGNQSFVNIYEGWFGPTKGVSYAWQVINQYAYTDETKTVGKGTTGLLPGDKVYVGFQAKNTGNVTWYRDGLNAIKLGTSYPLDRNSPFCDSTWGYGCNRPATMKEESVAPGQTGTFEFWMKAPSAAGNYPEHFNLVIDGQAWFPDVGLTYYASVQQPVYSWSFGGQYAYTDETKTVGKGTTGLLPGDKVYVGFQAKNTGNVTWTNSGPNPVNVGMTHPIDRSSPFYDGSWLGTNRPAKMKESSVAPGQTATFEFWMKIPNNPGTYTEYYSLVAEGAAWMNDPNMNFFITITQPRYTWQLVDQYAYSDQTKTVGKGTTHMSPGDLVYVGFKAKNTGNVTWKNSGPNPVNVGMTHPIDRLSNYYHSSWLGQNRPARLMEPSIAPGEIGTFEFWMKAPSTSGTSLEYFTLVSEGLSWFNDPNMNFYMSVN